MPQLDKVTFLSQFFWLCAFFLGLYLIVLKNFLPKMSRVLKYRKKRLGQSHQGVGNMHQENSLVRSSANKVLEGGLKNSKDLFKQNSQRTEKWLLDLIKGTNNTSFKNTNNTYLQSIGENSISYKLSLQGGFRDFSNTIFLSMLFNKVGDYKSVNN
jgi:F0F1-type ATP synthase membrane subunit b/b'